MNDARAVRVAELVQDFRNLQHYISQVRTEPQNGEIEGPGYAVLRQCLSEGSAVLNAPFDPVVSHDDIVEQNGQQKRDLQQ